MTRAISALLAKAVTAYQLEGIIPTDIAADLAVEGYDLTALDSDVERIASAQQPN